MNKGSLTISRPSYGNDKKVVSIKVRDVNSRVTFLEVEIGLDKFTECLTGLSEVECDIKTRDLDKVGKVKERKPFEFLMPKGNAWDVDRKEVAIRRATSLAPEGWKPDLYFNSQDSFFYKDGELYARTALLRWV